MKKLKKTIVILTVCVMAVTLMPLTASAKTYTHTIYYNLMGGYTFHNLSAIKVKDNAYFTISNQTPQKDNYRFKGYYAYRLKDKKWYVAGKGWVSSNKGAKLYKPGQKLRLDSSWTKGSKKSNYTLYAQWTHIHHVKFLKSNGSEVQKWQKDVADNESLKINCRLKRNGTYNIGWNLKRIDNSGTKWYVAGKGWLSNDVIKYYGYTKKLYTYGNSYKLDSSWTKGSSGWANYAFTPVY